MKTKQPVPDHAGTGCIASVDSEYAAEKEKTGGAKSSKTAPPYEKTNLKDQNQRDTKGKFEVLCFMPERAHGDQNADAAADGCCPEEGPLRYPPHLFSGV